jgi:ATP-binding cassette, subfamily F, member 3
VISLNNINVDFGSFSLLEEVSFLINRDDKIGLVGRNGAGKTTLMRLICDLQSPTSGKIEKPKDLNIGYLPQEKKFDGEQTVFLEALKAFDNVLLIRDEIAGIQHKLEHPAEFDEQELMNLFGRLNELNERFSMLEGDNIEMRTERVLSGLGFERHEFSQQMKTFSEGWQMRVELAKILLRQNDILLLDEPTNHLDIESIQWLEDYLVSFRGAILLVSHDRLFLDRVTHRTIEINYGRIYDYPVSYSKYTELRDERIEQQKKILDAKQKEIDQIEKFISRFRYKATKAKQVQSRIKMLEKMETENVDELNVSEISFRFPDCRPSGKIVIESDGLSKSYGPKQVLSNISFIISSGQKVSFVGRNGQGKTTLSRIIAEGLEHDGKLKHGYNVEIGYFPQNAGKFLNPSLTVLETAESSAHEDFRSRVRSVLGNFLFSGDDVYKKVTVLSGGEKSRLALAILMCRPSNFLVLDEPTNHLDMISKEVLKYALMNYKGTLVIVSHDRDFLDGLTDTVFYFNHQAIRQYPGTVSEFLHLKKLADMKALESLNVQSKNSAQSKEVSESKNQWAQKKEAERNKRKLTTRLEKIEKEIDVSEKLLASFETKMNSTVTDHSELNALIEEYAKTRQKLDELMHEWERVSHELIEQDSGL